jgi:hypothetical protein
MGRFGRVQSHDEEAWLEKIRMWSAAREDCLWIDRLEAGRSGRVVGVVSRLRLDPVSRLIEATISDGSGTLKAQWMIRYPPALMGSSPGCGLILDGMAEVGPKGQLFMLEPEFQVVPGPEDE